MMIAAVCLLLVLSSIIYYVCCCCFVGWFGDAKRRQGKMFEGVSLLIPVCGVDPGAVKNWISFCQQVFPNYEVLFGVKDRNDPAVPIIQQIIQKIEHGEIHAKACRVKLLFCTQALGSNHQISNLTYLLDAARHECVIFADSDIRVTPEYLGKVTAPLIDPAVGMVTCGYLDFKPKSLGAALSSFGRGFDFIPAVLFARWLDNGLKFAIGPTIATRKKVIEDIGGLTKLHNRIGSDYHLGKMAAEAGYRVEFSKYVLNNDCSQDSVRDVFLRELRWARTIRSNRGIQYYGILLSQGTVLCLPLLLMTGFQYWAIGIAASAIAARIVQVLLTIHHLGAGGLLRWLWILPIREGMNLAVWAGGCVGNSVYWRGRRLQIGLQGVILGTTPE